MVRLTVDTEPGGYLILPYGQILSEVMGGMKKMAETQEEVGPPFPYAFTTEEGFGKVGLE
jgi:hypothetical protein